jgi:hypothetical protein
MAKNKRVQSEAGRRISDWVKSQAAKKSSEPITSIPNEPPPKKIDPKVLWISLAVVGFVALVGLAVSIVPKTQASMQTVMGTVMLNGNAIGNCKVSFFREQKESAPIDPDRDIIGFAVTDRWGNYKIQNLQGEQGIASGNYKVTFVAKVTAKGQPVPAETKANEVEGGVTNLLPGDYGSPNTTRKSVKVEKGIVNVFNFDLEPK